jgi:hypothetical protein
MATELRFDEVFRLLIRNEVEFIVPLRPGAEDLDHLPGQVPDL